MKKLLLSIVLVLLVGLAVFVYAAQNWAGESSAPIYKGWNLVYGFISPDQLQGQGFEAKHIKAIYGFIPQNQEYIRLWPNPVEKEKVIDQLSQQAFWVYSDVDAGGSLNNIPNAIEYWLYNTPTPLSEIQLVKGWNFVGITPDMTGKSLSEIKGDCDIQRVVTYVSGSWRTWFDVNSEKNNDKVVVMPKENVGYGMVVKVSEDCKLGTPVGEVPPVPNLP